jgi:hypothetical protein
VPPVSNTLTEPPLGEFTLISKFWWSRSICPEPVTVSLWLDPLLLAARIDSLKATSAVLAFSVVR